MMIDRARSFFPRLAVWFWPMLGWAVPPHPTVLLVEDGAQRSPVVKVIGTDPVIHTDATEKRIRNRVSYYAMRAPHFGDGEVRFTSLAINGTTYHSTANYDDLPSPSAPVIGGAYEFEARLVPTVDLKGAFMAVLLFDTAFLNGAAATPAAEIIVNAIPELPAGRESTVKFRSTIAQRRGQTGYLPLVFAAGGGEVRSSASDFTARYFQRVERELLAGAVARYRAQFPAEDRPAAPFLTFQPILPDGARKPTEALMAELNVGADGLVREVALPGTVEPALSSVLRDTLSGWQFLPRLKSGQPAPARIQVPLRF